MTLLTRFDRWDPFEELNTLRGRMDRLFARMNTPEEATLANWTPLSDIVETKDEWERLPKMKKPLVGPSSSVLPQILQLEAPPTCRPCCWYSSPSVPTFLIVLR